MAFNDIQLPRDGNNRTINIGVLKTKIYDDGTYSYVCKAPPGTSLTASSWQITRITQSDGTVEYADGNVHFLKAASNIATVTAYSYN